MCVITPKCGPVTLTVVVWLVFIFLWTHFKENMHDTFANCQHEAS